MRQRKYKLLKPENEKSFFKGAFHQDEICKYHSAYYLYADVERIAKRYGAIVEYVGPVKYPIEYRAVGCFFLLF